MKIQKSLAILIALALLLCLLPATALADGDGGTPGDSGPVETDEPGTGDDPDPEQPQVTEQPGEEGKDDPAAGNYNPPVQPQPVADEEDEEDEEETDEDAPVVVAEGETGYAAEGQTVYNNGGLVYNNGALVYNNGGTVYHNGGTVYNNGGVVYANGGTVYNNNGTVYRNDALIYTFEEDDVVQSRIYGYFEVRTDEDYSELVTIEGLSEDRYLAADGSCVIRPRNGLVIFAAEADAGTLTENEDGSWTLAEVDADVTLSLQLRAESPVFDLEAGTYGEKQSLRISGPEGADLYYTTDGSVPREDNSQLYEDAIALSEGMTVTAVAVIDGVEPSEPTAASFAIVSIGAPKLQDGEEGEDPPKAAAFKLANPGKTDAKIESVALEGKNAGSFRLNTEKGGVVKAGKTDEKTWTIQPVKNLKKGSYTATAIFTLEGGQTVEVKISYKVK